MADDALTPKKGESLDLSSRAFRDVKTGRYTRGIDIRSILNSINMLEPTSKSLSEASVQLEEQVKIFAVKFKKAFGIEAKPVAAKLKRPSLSLMREGSEKLASSSWSLAKLALLLPLLFNETTKKILSGFFEGVLKGIGLSEDSIKIFKSIAAGAVMAFKVFLGYKVIKSVLDTFSAMKQLANATGILGLLVGEKGNEVALREKNVSTSNTELEADNSRLKKKGGRLQRVVRSLKARTKLLTRSVKKLFNFKKLAIGALKVIRTAARVIKTATAWTGLGFLIGAAVDAGLSTLLDFYTKEEDSEDTKESLFMTVGKSFADNFVQSLTFGALNLNDLKNMINSVIDAGISKKVIPEWIGKKLKFDTKSEDKPMPAATGDKKAGAPAAGAPPKMPVPQAKGSAAASSPQPAAAASTSAAAPASSSTSTMEQSSAIPAESIQTQSETNLSAKKEMSSSSLTVVNVDNSKNIVTKEDTKKSFSPEISFNSTVGA